MAPRTVNSKRPACPKCGSRQTLYTKRKKLSWCRLCGHEFKKDKAAEVALARG